MIKIMLVLYRKKGLSHDQFKEYYENIHVKLGFEHLGHLYKKYYRNYLNDPYYLTNYAGRQDAVSSSPLPDVITEIYLEDSKALDEWEKIGARPEVGRVLLKDEDNFIDRSKSLISIVTTEEGPVSDLS